MANGTYAKSLLYANPMAGTWSGPGRAGLGWSGAAASPQGPNQQGRITADATAGYQLVNVAGGQLADLTGRSLPPELG